MTSQRVKEPKPSIKELQRERSLTASIKELQRERGLTELESYRNNLITGNFDDADRFIASFKPHSSYFSKDELSRVTFGVFRIVAHAAVGYGPGTIYRDIAVGIANRFPRKDFSSSYNPIRVYNPFDAYPMVDRMLEELFLEGPKEDVLKSGNIFRGGLGNHKGVTIDLIATLGSDSFVQRMNLRLTHESFADLERKINALEKWLNIR